MSLNMVRVLQRILTLRIKRILTRMHISLMTLLEQRISILVQRYQTQLGEMAKEAKILNQSRIRINQDPKKIMMERIEMAKEIVFIKTLDTEMVEKVTETLDQTRKAKGNLTMIEMEIKILKEIENIRIQREEMILKEVQDLNLEANHTLKETGVKTLKERDLIKIQNTEMMKIVI